MSRNGYSLRGRLEADTGAEPPEKRQRTNDEPCVVYLGNVPKDWNEDNVRSVVAGSGDIVDIRVRIDPSGRSKNFVFVEFSSSEEAYRGMNLLKQITLGPNRKFRVELSKEGLRSQFRDRKPLQLSRDHLPFYVNLPAGMRESEPVDSHNSQNDTQYPISQPVAPKPDVPIPEILAKASQYLPAFQVQAFTMDDKISSNLLSLTPPQMIELIASLKAIIALNPAAAQQALNMSPTIPVAAAQALLLMGLIDPNVITTALQIAAPATSRAASESVSRNTPIGDTAHLQPDPRWPHLSASVGVKLARLPPEEAATIAQVLQLTPEVIESLPLEQRQIVQNMRRQYL